MNSNRQEHEQKEDYEILTLSGQQRQMQRFKIVSITGILFRNSNANGYWVVLLTEFFTPLVSALTKIFYIIHKLFFFQGPIGCEIRTTVRIK